MGGKSARVLPVSLGPLRDPAPSIFALLLGFVLVILPIGAIVMTSFVRVFGEPITLENLTLKHYAYILTFQTALEAFQNSFFLGIVAPPRWHFSWQASSPITA